MSNPAKIFYVRNVSSNRALTSEVFDSYEEASKRYRAYVNSNALGASKALVAKIVDENDEHVATIAFNGNVIARDKTVLYSPYG